MVRESFNQEGLQTIRLLREKITDNHFISSRLNSIFDLILPRVCLSCDTKLSKDEFYVCNNCNEKLEIATKKRIQEEFQRKFNKEKIISDFTSLYVFSENSVIQNLIHSLKYKGNFQTAKYLSKKIYDILFYDLESWNPDLIVPIPLHPLKKADRGYNQAAELSRYLNKLTKMKNANNIIKRAKFTQTQTKLNLEERKQNINGAFSIKNNKVIAGKIIILIDDVITTGATINECAKVLLDEGAEKIFALSVAIAE